MEREGGVREQEEDGERWGDGGAPGAGGKTERGSPF